MSLHLVISTYEWHPASPGGAGVFAAGAARLLARAGWRITALCDLPLEAVRAANRELDRSPLRPGNIRVISTSELVPGSEIATGGASYFDQKGQLFAAALRRLHAQNPIGLIEFPEYSGLGAATLDARQEGRFPLIPIVVRLHGGFEFIDEAEGIVPDDDRRRMYAAEARALRRADAVLAPSPAIGRLYAERYGLDAARIRVSPPPMEVLLDGLGRAERFVDPAHFLFYGKLQEVKGCDVFASAAAHLWREHSGRRWRFSFVGPDTPCARHGGQVSKCIARLLPDEAPFEAFEFIPWVDRRQLSRLARTVNAAVVPSKFEAFCLAAHELRAVGVPLVLSRLAAFEDSLSENTGCVTFDGSAEGLAAVLLRMRDEPEFAEGLAARPAPAYPDFCDAYQVLNERDLPLLARPGDTDMRWV